MTYIKDLKTNQYFEFDMYPGEWYHLVEDYGLKLDDVRYAVCLQTGKVRRFYHTQLVSIIPVKITRTSHA